MLSNLKEILTLIEKKTDPRVIRTRKLLIDSFNKLTSERDFKDITIQDIADGAMVNRATFYSHFQDKYDLMEFVISDIIHQGVGTSLTKYQQINEEVLTEIFLLVTNFEVEFEKNITSQCNRSIQAFKKLFETEVKRELEETFSSLMQNSSNKLDSDSIKIGAGLLSACIYEASINWKQSKTLSANEYISRALNFISSTYFFESV